MTHSKVAPPPKTSALSSYVSRYLTDFEPVRCLGKGGYGVVYESQNKIDECSYAVKRILLPATTRTREKVLREVKALAKLHHPNIVRYYNAWLETPPIGWQRQRDPTRKTALELLRESDLSDDIYVTPTEWRTANSESIEDTAQHQLRSPSMSGCARQVIDGARPRTLGASSVSMIHLLLTPETDKPVRATQEHRDSGGYSGSSFNGGVSDDSKSDMVVRDRAQNATTTPRASKLTSEGEESVLTEGSDFIDFLSDGSSSPTDSNSGCITATRHREAVADSETRPLAAPRDYAKKSTSSSSSCSRNEMIAGIRGPTYLYIQMELCRQESLKDWLAQTKTFQERQRHKVLKMFYQICSAVACVHKCGLVHRDLKPSNIFFETGVDNVIKVGDFGLVAGTGRITGRTSLRRSSISPVEVDATGQGGNGHDTSDMHTLTYGIGTTMYMTPEQMNGRKYGQKVDIYALGLILFELLWPMVTSMERIVKLTAVKQFIFPEGFKEKFCEEHELIRNMLALSPMLRPTVETILQHTLFDNFRRRCSAKTTERQAGYPRNRRNYAHFKKPKSSRLGCVIC